MESQIMEFIFTHAKLVKFCVHMENGSGPTSLNANLLSTIRPTGLLLSPNNLSSLLYLSPSSFSSFLYKCRKNWTFYSTEINYEVYFYTCKISKTLRSC
jgi:hypothetical protein